MKTKIPENILKGLKKETYPKEQLGGQTVGRLFSGITLTHEECQFSITISWHRSQIRNFELAMTFFELYLQETKII